VPIDPSLSSAALVYIMETAPVLALHLDAQQHVLTANAHARRLLGEKLVGRSLRELTLDFTPVPQLSTPGIADPSSHRLDLKTAGGLPESLYFRFFTLPDGWFALGNLDVEEQARLRTEVLALNRDLNNLSRQLHLANAELRELNQLKNQFLGMAAHDLRKPVGVVMTYTEFVLDEAGEALSDEHRKFLRTSLTACGDMKRLIDDFLDLAVIESGKLRLKLAPTTVAAILEGALEVSRLAAARKKVTLLADPVPNGAVWVDAPKLQQVLLNLVGNAVEHSQAGQRVWVSSQRHGPELLFAVRDEGPGISPEDQLRLFQPFSRASTGKTGGERSLGLGLQIARQIVQAHGGRIWVESVPGQGSTFRISLPLSTTPPK
jgi:signal transduction histidine kinase